jgi:hypothetical protein
MRLLIVSLLLAGVIFVAYGVMKENATAPPPTTEIRYVPQTILEEQGNQIPLSYTFGTMFNNSDSWIQSKGYSDTVS